MYSTLLRKLASAAGAQQGVHYGRPFPLRSGTLKRGHIGRCVATWWGHLDIAWVAPEGARAPRVEDGLWGSS